MLWFEGKIISSISSNLVTNVERYTKFINEITFQQFCCFADFFPLLEHHLDVSPFSFFLQLDVR